MSFSLLHLISLEEIKAIILLSSLKAGTIDKQFFFST